MNHSHKPPTDTAAAAATTGSNKRKPGRPKARQDTAVRDRLLDTAIDMAAREGTDTLTIRRVANAADVTPAMIHYYFGNRNGLLEAVLERAMAPVFQALAQWQQTTADGGQADGDGDGVSIHALMAAATTTIARNPWLPALIVRDVLGREGELREQFIQRIAGRGRDMITTNIQQAQAQGQIRPDADPTLTTLSLISLLMFPFIALPVSSRLYGVSLDEAFLQRLLKHNQQLLMRGLQP